MCCGRLVFSTSKKMARRLVGKGRSGSGGCAAALAANATSGVDSSTSSGSGSAVGAGGAGGLSGRVVAGGGVAARPELDFRLPRVRRRLVLFLGSVT
jgi:hypothetical protein